MKHQPRKRFGQNFLQNSAIIAAILDALQVKPHDKLIEIGPGLGALTKPLLQQVHQITAVEIDRDLAAHLENLAPNQLTLICADALRIDYSQWGQNIRIIGNLPYNISTPLLFHLLQYTNCIQDMHFMLQKEVVDRMAASPGSRDYGRLSVILGYFCEITPLFDVPGSAFFPEPAVTSSIVRLTPYKHRPYPEVAFEKLETVVARAFRMRRKTLLNNLKPVIDAKMLFTLGIDGNMRPEQISIADYVRLAAL